MSADSIRYRIAALAQQRQRLIETGQPVPYRITITLDVCGLYGPEVDRALGGEEPMVDEWEAGTRIPTREQMEALADLTGYPLWFFYMPIDGEPSGHGFLCQRSGQGKGCKRVQIGPPPELADVIPLHP